MFLENNHKKAFNFSIVRYIYRIFIAMIFIK